MCFWNLNVFFRTETNTVILSSKRTCWTGYRTGWTGCSRAPLSDTTSTTGPSTQWNECRLRHQCWPIFHQDRDRYDLGLVLFFVKKVLLKSRFVARGTAELALKTTFVCFLLKTVCLRFWTKSDQKRVCILNSVLFWCWAMQFFL